MSSSYLFGSLVELTWSLNCVLFGALHFFGPVPSFSRKLTSSFSSSSAPQHHPAFLMDQSKTPVTAYQAQLALHHWQRYNFELLRFKLYLQGCQVNQPQASESHPPLPSPLQYRNHPGQCMTPAERAPYTEIANSQRERLGLEMPTTSGITISSAESSVGRKRKRAVKDPNAPKRATTAFFFFAQEERPKVREVNPEFKVTDISKKLGEMWRGMDAEQKQRFQDLAVKDRERYHAEQKIYTEKVEAEKKNANGTQGSAA